MRPGWISADVNSAMISVCDLTLGFASPLISRLDFEIIAGERIGVTGRSGLGKTKLVEAIIQTATGEASPTIRAGRIYVAETAVGYSPQRVGVPRWFRAGALIGRLIGRAPAARQAGLVKICNRLGLDRLANSFPRTLSGGETQRLSLMIALSLAGDLLILDEPLTALDLATKTEVIAAARQFLDDHAIATFIVSHDLDLLISLAQKIYVLGETGITASVAISADAQQNMASGGAVEARAALLSGLQKQNSLPRS